MVIKYKMFPYPVLTDFTDDYVDSKFDVLIEEVIHGFDRKLYFSATLKNDGLLQLIKDGKARFVYHLECSQTGFREAVQTNAKMKDYVLEHEKVRGKLQICPFIVATENISNYTNTAFHSDYDGISFDIEAGCVLAIGAPREMMIEPETDDLAKIPSIFSIIRNLDSSVTYMTVETSRERIIIQLPLEDFTKYGLLDSGTMLPDVLNTMVVIPALVFALDEIKREKPEERYQYEENGRLWYTTIKKVLQERFSCDIESRSFDDFNTIELAQRIINEPLHRALDSLTQLSDSQNGGGD